MLLFEAVAGLNVSRAQKLAAKGIQTCEPQSRRSKAVRRDQMIAAIWMVVQQLHHQSPYAKDAVEGVWHIPFHQKVCLWRLIQKVHEARPQDSAPIFTAKPTYLEFRGAIRRPEFNKVISTASWT